MSDERQKLELSFSGVVAGALATISATVVASFFGAYGTIVGAAASSVVSTAGAAIYQHFFRRTGDKLKEAGQHLSPTGLRNTLVSERGAATVTTADPRLPRQGGPEQADRPVRSGERTGSGSARPRTLADVMGEAQGRTTARIVDGTNGRAEQPDDATSAKGEVTGEAERSLGAFGGSPEGDRTEQPGAFSAAGGTEGGERENGTRVVGSAGEPGGTGSADDDETVVAGAGGGPNLADSDDAETMAINRMSGVSQVYTASGPGREGPSLGVMLGWARGKWAKLLAGAVALFVVVMGAVTIVEAVMDRPLSAAVRGESGQGTTLTGGNGQRPAGNPTEKPSVTGTPGPSQSAGPNPGNTAQSTPNPQQTAPDQGRTNGPQQPSERPSTAPSQQQPSGTPEGRNDTNDGTDDGNNAQPRQAPATQQ